MAEDMRVKVWLAGGISAFAVIALSVVVAGCGSDTSEQAETETQTQTTSAAPATSDTRQARPHNDDDVMFAHHMIPHHQQAIEMSDILLAKTGIDPRVTELADQIKAAQGPEIDQMQAWLKQWGNPPMPSMPSGHGGHGDEPGDDQGGMAGMAGMVSDADMAALRDAEGVDAARLFLTHMIAHHEGAIDMAQEEVNEGRFEDAVQMARTIVIMQEQEIKQMREILDTL
ncbi:DUF305 domain-containing protein [Mycolicibacterium goodii]|uniref:DUF305 domain-containing protein n=1 Tax=Mycolicibacterium goodii TaxID=134601 RepID=UPI00256F1D35|nr:DUF305 domain-containing protein [Mycolicibacterium goodii]